MNEQTQVRVIKCPHCGWEREITLHIEAGKVDVVAGLDGLVKDMIEKIKKLMEDEELKQANAWIVMQPCPNPRCKRVYEYNVISGEARK